MPRLLNHDFGVLFSRRADVELQDSVVMDGERCRFKSTRLGAMKEEHA